MKNFVETIADLMATGYREFNVEEKLAQDIVLKAIEQSGLKVPQDISVMGFDDLMFSSMLSAPLSSVKQDLEGMCDKMCSILYDALDGKTVENSVSLFKATPIYRESVKEAN